MSTPPSRFLVGRYRLISLLGKGGMGTVWLASDDLLRQHVAIKEVRLPPDLDEGLRAELRERTLREARAAARLRAHPSIVTVHDIVIEDERPWIVMEFVQGRSLGQIIRDQGPLPAHQVADIGLHMLDALGAAHGSGILHRDIKPPNILITAEGRVVLTEFGIATVSGDPSLTQSGMLTGTPGFVAPERLRGEDDGPPSDLWSLGATLFAAVEGQAPYARERPTAVLAAVLMQEPNPMRLAGPLAPVLTGLLEKDPARRITREQAILQLRPIAAGTAPPPLGVPGGPASSTPPRRGTAASTQPSPRGGGTQATAPEPRPASRKRSVILGSVLAVVMVTAAGVATRDVWLSPQTTARPPGGTTTRATSAAAPSPAKEKEALYRGDPEACKLLTDQQAGRIIGTPVKRQFQTHSGCMWMKGDTGVFMNLTTIRSATSDFAHMVYSTTRTTMEEEPRRTPGTRLRSRSTAGDESFAYTREEVIVSTRIYRTQILFRKGNMTIVLYFTLHTPGYARADLAARLVEKNLEAFR
ncbi:serine/threonine-protein kinase [Sphaerisporangium flaviroseum]|uniref:serine/threonine-protein kinase n=1 Tax=Sphaerisporangium flaviroseum TaxID=509199 RepID=UPI0031F147DF